MRNYNDLASWRIFFRVIETGSIQKTADEYGVEPSSISRRVSTLEQSTGLQLLLRTTRQLKATDVGLQAYQQLLPLVAQFDTVVQNLGIESAHLSGKVRISAPVALGEFILIQWLAELQEIHPALEFDLELSNRHVDLLGDGIDLALRLGQLQDDKVIATPLGTIASVSCAAPHYLERYGTPIHPHDLTKHRLILYSGLAGRGTIDFRRANETISVAYQGSLQTNNLTALSQAAIAGMGIHLLNPLFQCADDLAQGRLVQILHEWHTFEVPVHIVRLLKKTTPARVLIVMEHLKQRWIQAPWTSGAARTE